MVRNYYTLLHIAREIETLAGCVVDECFSQEKDELIIRLNDGKRENYIIFNADGKYDSIFLQPKFRRAGKNSVALLESLEGDILQSAEVLGKSRIIKINFLHSTVYAVLFGGVYSNFLVLNSDNLIIDSFKAGQYQTESAFMPPEEHQKNVSDFPSDTKIKSAIANSKYLFGNTYASEVFHRLSDGTIKPEMQISDLNANQFDAILRISDELKNELESSNHFFVLENSSGKNIMSPVKLCGYELKSNHDSVSEAVHKRNVSDIIESRFSAEYSKIKNFLDKQQRKLEKAIENMQDIESAEKRMADYRLWAELLLSHPECKGKFGESIEVADWSGNSFNIKIDPKLNLIENAKKYFDKAHSTQEDIKIRKKRLPEMIDKLKIVRQKNDDLSKVNRLKDLTRFEGTIKQSTGKRVNTKKMTMEEKFRKFELGEGYVLYAGKNASNNDELTMKFANQNDVWLHARGSSGSHTIIRMDKEEKPPKNILQRAAEITAFYSGARNAKYVPVIWTFKKYVRKPKGANVGAVVVSKETVIMAEPKLPDDNN
ncbi:MAG: DUF814 domain-containing protein [Candidatus Kapabacteria bacterium]|nr:DUF814 domain-containing protein [Ignavibacteriota bacterium]MCW5885456.1 DUF814 domain-containing protein [Candidatus Kapabacteria bacterium]